MKKPDRDVDIATQNDWYKGMNRLIKVIELYKRHAKFNWICTCASQLKTDDSTTLKYYKLALPGGLAEPVAGAFDVVAFMQAQAGSETVTRSFQTVETSKVTVAKDRNIIRKARLENPTMATIWQAMKEAETQLEVHTS